MESRDRITVDGLPGKVYDILEFDDPNGSDMIIASIGVIFDNEPGVIRLVEFDQHQLKLDR